MIFERTVLFSPELSTRVTRDTAALLPAALNLWATLGPALSADSWVDVPHHERLGLQVRAWHQGSLCVVHWRSSSGAIAASLVLSAVAGDEDGLALRSVRQAAPPSGWAYPWEYGMIVLTRPRTVPLLVQIPWAEPGVTAYLHGLVQDMAPYLASVCWSRRAVATGCQPLGLACPGGYAFLGFG